jgi:hypothetical protein
MDYENERPSIAQDWDMKYVPEHGEVAKLSRMTTKGEREFLKRRGKKPVNDCWHRLNQAEHKLQMEKNKAKQRLNDED